MALAFVACILRFGLTAETLIAVVFVSLMVLLAAIDLTGFDVWGEATRGEVAQVLWNLKGK